MRVTVGVLIVLALARILLALGDILVIATIAIVIAHSLHASGSR